jgi:plastocyanin
MPCRHEELLMSANQTSHAARRRSYLAWLAAIVLSLAACGGGNSGTPTAGATSGTVPEPSASQTTSASPALATAPASQAANARCAVTPGATPVATVKWNVKVEGGSPTIKAGEAVAFATQEAGRPTVTEGTKGTPVAQPCVDKVLDPNSSIVVTFYQPGVYNLFCRNLPETMYTVVNVQ